MSTTYTPKISLGIPGVADRDYNLVIDPNWTTLDGMGAIGPLAVTYNEVPSASTTVAVAAGAFRASDGSDVTYAGTTGLSVTTSATTKIWLDEAGAIHTGSSYPSGPLVKLASVTADTSVITAIMDDRRYLDSTGGLPRMPVRTVTAATDTTTRADGVILANATSNAIAETLGTLASTDAGLQVVVVKTDSSANAVTVATIGGGTVTLAAQYDAVQARWTGSAWVAPSTVVSPRNAVRTVTATTDTPTAADRTIYADATAAAITFTLPTLGAGYKGTPLKIMKSDSGANTVTVGTIAGGNSTLSSQHQFVAVEWDGSAWQKFSA